MRVDKYTPGPWFVAGTGSFKVATLTAEMGVYANSMVTNDPTNDARLISAAPDLLRALEKIMWSLGEQVHMHGGDGLDEEAWAAIAKAIGRESMP